MIQQQVNFDRFHRTPPHKDVLPTNATQEAVRVRVRV